MALGYTTSKHPGRGRSIATTISVERTKNRTRPFVACIRIGGVGGKRRRGTIGVVTEVGINSDCASGKTAKAAISRVLRGMAQKLDDRNDSDDRGY